MHKYICYGEENAAEAVLQADDATGRFEKYEHGGNETKMGRRRDLEESSVRHASEEQIEKTKVGKTKGYGPIVLVACLSAEMQQCRSIRRCCSPVRTKPLALFRSWNIPTTNTQNRRSSTSRSDRTLRDWTGPEAASIDCAKHHNNVANTMGSSEHH